MKVLVLGCGPAGLLTAHAFRLTGHRIEIVSKKEPSFISGAQYLHSAIPELTDPWPEDEVQYYKIGKAEGYALKIYGAPDAGTSWPKFPEGPHKAWPLEQYYHQLWDMYVDNIFDGDFLPGMLTAALIEYDFVASTIPLRALFPDRQYKSEAVFIVPGVPEYYDRLEHHWILYNGNPSTPYYRASNLWQHKFTEYPSTFVNARYMPGSRMIHKPLSSDVRNHYQNLALLGRFGRWEKGVLVDDAFRQALSIGEQL